MYHSGLNIIVGLYIQISSYCGEHHGHGGWSHSLLGLFN